MGACWMVHPVRGHEDPGDAWAELIRRNWCDCVAGSPPGSAIEHVDSCSAPWWIAEDFKMSAGYEIRQAPNSPWSDLHIQWSLPLRMEADRHRGNSSSPVGYKFGPWAATPLGPGSFEPLDPVATHIESMSLDEFAALDDHYQVSADMKYRWLGAVKQHDAEIGVIPTRRTLSITAQRSRWQPSGEITGWVFYGWVNT